MLTQTQHILIIAAIAILLPSVFSYSIYGINNPRRDSHANTNNHNPSFSSDSRQQQAFDPSGYRSSASSSPLSSYYSNYDSLYDSEPVADNYYVDDDGDVNRPEREYFYGKPTYHGEYKPSRYYYARAPYYNYYNEHSESTNPLDDLHEEMIQEEHERSRNWPAGKTNWFQNTGQPKSLTNNFMKNLMLQKQQQQPIDVSNIYDEIDVDSDDIHVESPYFNNQNEPYEYFDPLKFQSQPYNHFVDSTAKKPTYFNQNKIINKGNKETTNFQTSSMNRKQNDYDDDRGHNKHHKFQPNHELNEDKEEKDLESLRKPMKNSWNNDKSDAEKHTMVNDEYNFNTNSKHDDTYNDGINTGFDYEEDEWINWDRKRSLPKKQNESLRPLKVLEYQLTKALQEQKSVDASKLHTSTAMVIPTTTTSSSRSSTSNNSENKANKHEGQKEVVLSRPATPIRHHFSDSVLDALMKTTNDMKQVNQDNNAKNDGIQDDAPKDLTKLTGNKHKRFVSSETSLEQQLNGLKRKIKA